MIPLPHPCFRLKKICAASFRETCQCLKFPLNGLRSQSRLSPMVGLLPSASGSICLRMAFPPLLVKQLYRCDSVVISSFVRTEYEVCPKSKSTDFLFKCLLDSPEITSYLLQSMTLGKLDSNSVFSTDCSSTGSHFP